MTYTVVLPNPIHPWTYQKFESYADALKAVEYHNYFLTEDEEDYMAYVEIESGDPS